MHKETIREMEETNKMMLIFSWQTVDEIARSTNDVNDQVSCGKRCSESIACHVVIFSHNKRQTYET